MNRPERIVFDARLVLDHPTGIGQYIASLLGALVRVAPTKDLLILRRRDPWPAYGLADLPAEQIVCNVRHMSLAQRWQIPSLLRRIRPDVYHYPHFDAPVDLYDGATVATIHDAKYLVAPNLFPRFGVAKRSYMRWAFARTVRRAHRTIVPSRSTAADLERLFRFDTERLHVVHSGVDPSYGPATAKEIEDFRRRRGLTRPYILCVAEFRPHKNHETLLDAWARTRARENHDLVLIGRRHVDGVSPEELARVAGVAPIVLADVDHDELRAAYSDAAVFVLPSRYEGFGFPVLEAMACGTPVIASSTTSLGEVVGDAGVTISPDDPLDIARSIDELLADPERCANLREKGRQHCREFDWNVAARETDRIYSEINRPAC